MRLSKYPIIILSVVSCSITLWCCSKQEPPVLSQEKHKVNKRIIEAKDVYSTSAEGGFKKRVQAVFKRDKDNREIGAFPYSWFLKEIEKEAFGAGPSNVALVRASDITQAIECTMLIFARGRSADRPPPDDSRPKEIKSKDLWLVAYMGTGWSGPTKWKFESVVVENKNIEFRYKEPNPEFFSADLIQYFYWVPLGPMPPEVYELSLYDTGKSRKVLSRCVEVPKIKE